MQRKCHDRTGCNEDGQEVERRKRKEKRFVGKNRQSKQKINSHGWQQQQQQNIDQCLFERTLQECHEYDGFHRGYQRLVG